MAYLTRAEAEYTLVKRCGSMLTAAGLDGTTVDGTNADLNDPLVHSLRTTEAVHMDPITDIDDAALANIDYCRVQMFLDFATLYTFEAILYNLITVDITVGPRTEKLDQLAKRVEKIIDRLHERFAKDYGYHMLSALDVGYIQLDFVEHDDE